MFGSDVGGPPVIGKQLFNPAVRVRRTNPEELIGAAHAACFSMALSMMLGEEGHAAEEIQTEAEISMEKQDQGFTIVSSHLRVNANVPGIPEALFIEIAEKAKTGCPVSKLLNAEISMDAKLA